MKLNTNTAVVSFINCLFRLCDYAISMQLFKMASCFCFFYKNQKLVFH
jgi:hypothetical protein